MNKQKSMILLTFCTVPLLLYAEPQPPDTLWTRTYGGSGDDIGNSVQQTSDDGYIIAGGTYSFGAGDSDVYLTKIDIAGDELWSQTFGGEGYDLGTSVQQTTDGGYIIAGCTFSYGAGNRDVYLIKTDANGNESWSQTFGGSANDWGYNVQQTNDGGYIIAGSTQSIGAGGYDVYLIKTDESGNEQWNETFGESGNDEGYSVQQTTDGGYIIAGLIHPNGTSIYVYLIKTDSIGNESWSRTFGGDDNDFGKSVQQTSDDGYIIVGLTDSFGAGSRDVYLIKTDSNGNDSWTQTYGGSGYDRSMNGQLTTDGGCIISGWTESFGVGGYDVYLIKTDSNGNESWSVTFGGNDHDYGYSVQQTSDSGYIVAGYTQSYGAGGSDVYLIRLEGDETLSPITVSDVNPFQIVSPSKVIQIGYGLSQNEYLPCSIVLQISSDGGLNWNIPAIHAWGDIGPNIAPGICKTIYWNAGLDYPNQYNDNMRIKIIADDGE